MANTGFIQTGLIEPFNVVHRALLDNQIGIHTDGIVGVNPFGGPNDKRPHGGLGTQATGINDQAGIGRGLGLLPALATLRCRCLVGGSQERADKGQTPVQAAVGLFHFFQHTLAKVQALSEAVRAKHGHLDIDFHCAIRQITGLPNHMRAFDHGLYLEPDHIAFSHKIFDSGG